MTEGKFPRGPTLLGWGDLCHSSVWGFTGFKLELELHGLTLSWVDWLLPSRGKALYSRPSQYRGRAEAEAIRSRPRQDHVRPRRDRAS